MYKTTISIETNGKGLYDITRAINQAVRASEVKDGLAIAFVRHTSASLVIQENADPSVQDDLLAFFARLVPENDPIYTHRQEGPDDMPAHIRSALTHTSETMPVVDGQLALGTWQGLYLFEHRRAPHRRQIEIRILD